MKRFESTSAREELTVALLRSDCNLGHSFRLSNIPLVKLRDWCRRRTLIGATAFCHLR
jgi:hypothetical protein